VIDYTCCVVGLYVALALVLAVRNHRRRAAEERWERHVASARAATEAEPPEHHALILPFPDKPAARSKP
jgi:hypothetical protein